MVIFDLDGTLARSKQPIAPSTAALLSALLSRTKVAVVSGGALLQFETQVVAQLPTDASLENLYLLPTSGAALYEWRAAKWIKVYEERIPEDEAYKIQETVRFAAEETGVIDFATPSFGDRIEYRGAQITLSALGQEAPIAAKEAWDPTKSKRHALQKAIASKLHGYAVSMGGKTSIDVTKEGIDKAYGIHQLSKRLQIPEANMLYVGDELEKGGNDEAVYKTEAKAKPIQNPTETEQLIQEILAIP